MRNGANEWLSVLISVLWWFLLLSSSLQLLLSLLSSQLFWSSRYMFYLSSSDGTAIHKSFIWLAASSKAIMVGIIIRTLGYLCIRDCGQFAVKDGLLVISL